MNRPSAVSAALLHIASKIDRSERPDRALVAREIRRVLASIQGLQESIQQALAECIANPGSFEHVWGDEQTMSALQMVMNEDTGEVELTYVPDINDRDARPVYSAPADEFDVAAATAAAERAMA